MTEENYLRPREDPVREKIEEIIEPDRQTFESYRQASDLEEINPKKALKIYGKLARKNLKYSRIILSIAIICPIIGFIIASFIGQCIPSHRYLVAVLIWCGIGFLPLLMVTVKISRLVMGVKSEEKLFGGLLTVPLAIYIAFVDVIQFAILIFIASLIQFVILGISSFIYHIVSGAPFIQPIDMAINMPYLYWPVFIVCFIIAFLFMVSDLPITDIFSKKAIMVMRLKLKKILLFFLGLWIAFAVGGGILGSFEVTYDGLIRGIAMSAFTGTMIGLTLAPREKDFLLGKLYQLAKARCLIRMDREVEAEYLLEEEIIETVPTPDFFYERRMGDTALAIKKLARATLLATENTPQEEIIEYTNDARDLASADKYKEILSVNIQKTEEMGIFVRSSDLERLALKLLKLKKTVNNSE